MDLGTHYLALSVNDILEAFLFYKKLGFEPPENGGSLDDKWLVLANGSLKIGLFQGMFAQNTLTFNPKDARSIFGRLKDDVKVNASSGMDAPAGPCYFMVSDPDGNHLLFDQHND